MMKHLLLKKRLPLVLLFVLLITIPLISGIVVAEDNPDTDTVYQYLKAYHINGQNVIPGSIEEMIESVDDPYTEYFTPEGYHAFINQIDGTLVGVGIHLEERDGAVIVLAPIKDSPAEKAGIKSGDIIIGVNGTSVVGKALTEITSQVRGDEGTKVSLTVKRGEEHITFELIRAKIELPLVEYELLKEDGIGYVQINSFGDNTLKELVQALAEMQYAGMESLLLDVRGNPGGKVDSVLAIASLFVGEGPILHVKNGANNESAYTSYGDKWWNTPIVLLTDRGSASASEVLAGALRDYHLATIIGEKTFGKGVMQSLVSLPSGSVLKLTTNEFFSPRKIKIHQIGITPDITGFNENDPLTYAKEWLKAASALRSGNKAELVIEKAKVRSIEDWALQKDGQWYIALYRLRAMVGGELFWDGSTRTTTYTINDVTHKYAVGYDTMLIKNDHIYAPLSSLTGLPNLSISLDKDGNLHLLRK